MKTTIVTLLALSASQVSFAQIDLDHPIRVSATDQVFLSSADPGVAYAFPKALVRLSEPQILREGARLIAVFDVGVDPVETKRLKVALAASRYNGLELRYIRPLSIHLIPGSATNLPEGFHPEVFAIGDPAILDGAVPYRLEVDRAKWFLTPAKGLRLLSIVFGPNHMDHIGTLEYEFNSVVGGKPLINRSQLPIFVGESGL